MVNKGLSWFIMVYTGLYHAYKGLSWFLRVYHCL